MKNKRKKVQITLPEYLTNKIREQSSVEFVSISAWIERASLFYIENNKGNSSLKKKIDLGI